MRFNFYSLSASGKSEKVLVFRRIVPVKHLLNSSSRMVKIFDARCEITYQHSQARTSEGILQYPSQDMILIWDSTLIDIRTIHAALLQEPYFFVIQSRNNPIESEKTFIYRY